MTGDLEFGSWRLFNNIKANFYLLRRFLCLLLLSIVLCYPLVLSHPSILVSLLIKPCFRSCVKGSHRRRKPQRRTVTAFIGGTP